MSYGCRLRNVSRGYAEIVVEGAPVMRVHRDSDGWWEVSVLRDDGNFWIGEMGDCQRTRRRAVWEAVDIVRREPS